MENGQPSVKEAVGHGVSFHCPNCDEYIQVVPGGDPMLEEMSTVTIECRLCTWGKTFKSRNFDREIPSSLSDYEVLTDISGVGKGKAEALHDAGFEQVQDVRLASQHELGNVQGIGMALAARMKADVGDAGNTFNIVMTEPVTEQESGCPVSNCSADPDEDEMYNHMLSVHGFWTEDLEVVQ